MRDNHRRGSTILELALTLLPTLALLLTITDLTLPVFVNTMFNHAVRAGTRYAITYQTESGLSHTASIKQIVQENTFGFLAGTEGLNKIKVKFYSPTTFQEVTGSNANAGGNIVEVSIDGYSWGWLAPIWRSATPLGVRARSSDRMESLPRNVARPAP